MTLFKKISILTLLAIFAKAPLAAAGEGKELPGDNHAVAHGGEYQSIPAATAAADEPVAGGSASAAPSEFDHTYSEEATAELIRRFQYENGLWNPNICPETIQDLLDKSANVNVTDNNRKTLLMYAALYNNLPMVQFLLKNGANVDVKDKWFGRTALMWVVQKGYIDIAEHLLDKDANVNTTDEDGKTALILAVRNNDLPMVQCLLDKNADVNIEDNERKTALDYAESEEIRALLAASASDFVFK